MDSPGSPLSELSSDEFQEDVKTEDRSLSVDTFDHDNTRPSKRQRTGAGPSSALANFRGATPEAPPPDADADIYISEDTDGSVPASPHHTYGGGGGGGGMQEEESFGQEQVTVCKWEGCEAGDLGNMDKLVDHLHDDHIGTRQKKYSCEWTDCARKGIPHASGYALRAHMRSHTREKPFYCTLPECDRAFTRSDALAKHMRTVHETEALRPSDPVPKHHSSNPSNKNQRLRLVFKNNGTEKAGSPLPASPHSQGAAGQQQQQQPPSAENEYEHNNVICRPLDPTIPHSPLTRKFPQDINFTKEELRLSAPQLARLLQRQIQWATEEGEELKVQVEALEKSRRDEWTAKELTLENVMEAELGRMERVDRLLNEENASTAAFRDMLREDVKVGKTLDVQPKPNWRDIAPVQKTREKEGLEAESAMAVDLADARRFDAAGDPVGERRPESMGIGVAGGP